MILWTVPQSHPFPQSASQLSSCQEAFMGTKMYSRISEHPAYYTLKHVPESI